MRKLKIFTTTWHVMHFWDLFNALKKDADFFVCYNMWRDWERDEFLAARDIPENATFVCDYEKGKYDFAIFDVDQQITNPDLGKSKVFRDFFELVQDIPKVIINHASPIYPEYAALMEGDKTKAGAQRQCIQIIKGLIGDTLMVTNSYTAASDKEWGWGYPIWHGMDKNEWLDLPKEPRVFTALSVAGCDEYYNRQLMNEVKRQLEETWGYKLLWAKYTLPDTARSLDIYKDYLGRSLIYFDSSYRTPMNRARTEAMFSGCCVVQVEGAHDLDKFAKDGENIILVPNNPTDATEKLVDLIENHYDDCLKIGQAGKQTAIKLFNRERYRQDWLKFIKEILKVKL